MITDASKDTCKEQPEIAVSGSISKLLWVNSSIIEAQVRSDPAAHLSFFPEYFEHGHLLRAFLQSDEMCSSPVDHPHRKMVSIGPQYQAYVPEWNKQGSNPSDNLQTEFELLIETDEEKMMGTCVISMPDIEASQNLCFEDCGSKTKCSCLDKGSVCCVKQHVIEAREKLRENLGQELFEQLGFHEMGEEVSKQWTDDEELTFLEVVLSNRASLGMNFWDHLLVAFPSRKRKDLVSYYFNVFMLRKRGEQNRFDPLNIDSDDDEWQKTETRMSEDDGSVVESPNEDAPTYFQGDILEEWVGDIEDGNEEDACKDGTDVDCRLGTDEVDGGDVDDGSGAYVKISPGDCGGGVDINLSGKIPSNGREDYDIQDDSCTSFEYQRDRVELCGPLDEGVQFCGPLHDGIRATDTSDYSVE